MVTMVTPVQLFSAGAEQTNKWQGCIPTTPPALWARGPIYAFKTPGGPPTPMPTGSLPIHQQLARTARPTVTPIATATSTPVPPPPTPRATATLFSTTRRPPRSTPGVTPTTTPTVTPTATPTPTP